MLLQSNISRCSWVKQAAPQPCPILSTSAIAHVSPCSFRAGPSKSRSTRCHATRPGSSVLDSPVTTPTYENGTENVKKRPPNYKVMLHNDNYNKREYVVRILLKVVEKITMDDALQVMQEAHENGMAMVIACAQDEAENYCENLRLNGLTSSMEPGSC